MGVYCFLYTNFCSYNITCRRTAMLIGAVGEEIGWRGFLQPNLEKNIQYNYPQ